MQMMLNCLKQCNMLLVHLLKPYFLKKKFFVKYFDKYLRGREFQIFF